MTTLWIHPQVIHVLGRDGTKALGAIIESIEAKPLTPPDGTAERAMHGMRFQIGGLVRDVVGLFEAQPSAGPCAPSLPSGRRALLISSDVLDEIRGDLWGNVYPRLADLSNIDEARQRSGLKFIQQGAVATIFIPGEYQRITFVIEPGVVVLLGTVAGEVFASHAASSSIVQPSARDRDLWKRLHAVAQRTREQAARLRVAPTTPTPPAPVPTYGPLADGWITLNRLNELGIAVEAAKRAVLAVDSEPDLADIMGIVPDEAYEQIERHFYSFDARRRAQEAREREAQFSSLEIVKLSLPVRRLEGEMSFEEALAKLTDRQRAVACRERDAPLRVKGGPGTGKTLTAILRAGFLARRAQKQGQAVRIGFFVFNTDLGRDIATRMDAIGLGEFLTEDAPQSIVVTSLHEWCRRFVRLDELKVEPLEPYRADHTQENRRAALELAVEEARKRLVTPEHAELWGVFDTKSKSGLREIETEISQFIKARDITDLASYVAERRPAKWWLSGTSRAFKTFVWEVAAIYNDVLRQLGFMDADDLTNDAVKEVSKSVWQTYQKPTAGFDYLILDEAQDFFRNQLTLVRQLVKRPDGFMMCFDEAQAVYARFPSLREIGFDTSMAFEGSRLERNFRSSREIVAALRELATKYPVVGLQDDWGDFEAAGDQEKGPRPRAAGFATEDGMLRQVRDRIRAAIDAGSKPTSIAVIGFDDALLGRVADRLHEDGLKTHAIEGDGRRASGRAINLASARFAKGQQFETCILVGLDRDSLPDFRDVKSALHGETRREDDLRLFVVALSRAKREVHLLWCGPEPSEFVSALGHTVDRAE